MLPLPREALRPRCSFIRQAASYLTTTMQQGRIDELLAPFTRFRAGGVLRYAILAAGLAAMTAMTVPGFERPTWIVGLLWTCLGFFALELFLKVWRRADRSATLDYLSSGDGIIDLLAIVPVPLALLAGVHPENAWLLASLWILKLAADVPGLSMLGRVIALEARPLASVLVLFLIVLLFSGVSLHILERADKPDQFGTLPKALWWAVTTLTTTGYGDSAPETYLGRTIAIVVMICGLGLFGLLTGILATGFANEHRRRDFVRNWDLVTSVPFLRNLDAPAIIEITRLLRRLDLPAYSIVVRRGRTGDCMYFIASGEVEVKVEPRPIRLGAGAFFGEIALLHGGPRTASVITTSPSTLLILDVTDFRAFAAHHPQLALALEDEAKRREAPSEIPAATGSS